jgi:hypothetical protein
VQSVKDQPLLDIIQIPADTPQECVGSFTGERRQIGKL